MNYSPALTQIIIISISGSMFCENINFFNEMVLFSTKRMLFLPFKKFNKSQSPKEISVVSIESLNPTNVFFVH